MNIIEQFEGKIKGVLSTFDRILIKGYFTDFWNPSSRGFFLYANSVLYKDFGSYAENITKEIDKDIKEYVKNLNRPTVYLPSSKISKEQTALEIFKNSPVKDGLVCCIETVELCSTFTPKLNKQTNKLELMSEQRKCKHYYFYYNDEEFGWMFVKMQSWFPFSMEVYINGREWLSKKLDKNEVKYVRYDNCFIDISDIPKAQELANQIDTSALCDTFDAFAKKINWYLPVINKTFNRGYYWYVDQCEYATDIMFESRSDLEEIYSSLVEHAFFNFSSKDIMSFLGRKLDPKFQGEIVTKINERKEGVRIKHRMKKNSLKMYDKYSVLRIETTINDPHEFKVLTTDEQTGDVKLKPMGKGIVNLPSLAKVANATNNRYIKALVNIVPKQSRINELERLSSSVEVNNRKYSSFNIFDKETLTLFETITTGDFIINGFRNNDIYLELFGNVIDKKNKAKMTRLLGKLKAHGIIKKVNNTLKYYVTDNGRKTLSSIVHFKNKEYAA